MICMRDLGMGCLVVVVSVVSESNGRLAFERTPQTTGKSAAWVEQSNRHAQVLLDVLARVSPESAGGLGVQGLDDQIADVSAEAVRGQIEATSAARAKLQQIRQTETDPLVRQDLEI